jgi:hypothetical protein
MFAKHGDEDVMARIQEKGRRLAPRAGHEGFSSMSAIGHPSDVDWGEA